MLQPLGHPRRDATRARWFARSGLFEEAIQHAFAAGDFARAADLLTPNADPLWMDGQMATLRRWLAYLPGEVLQTHPRLLIAQAGALFFLKSRQIGAIEATLQEAEAALRASRSPGAGTAALVAAESDQLSGRITALRASQASWQPDTGRTIALGQGALDRLGPDEPLWRLIALTAVGMACALRGEPDAALGPLVEASSLSPAAGASYVTLGPQLWLGIVHVMQGKLHASSARFRQGLVQVSRRGAENLTAANFLIGLGFWVEYEWNDLAATEHHLAEGIRLAGRQQWP